jgi:hypothetical protein
MSYHRNSPEPEEATQKTPTTASTPKVVSMTLHTVALPGTSTGALFSYNTSLGIEDVVRDSGDLTTNY